MDDSLVVMLVTVLLYVAVPAYLLFRGWPLRAGLAMLLIAQFPLIWQVSFTDSDMPGFGGLMILMLPLPLLLIGLGLVAAIFRFVVGRREIHDGVSPPMPPSL